MQNHNLIFKKYFKTKKIILFLILFFLFLGQIYLLNSNKNSAFTKESIKTASVDVGSNVADNLKYYKVVKVVDGDTVDVDLGGNVARVRLLGINTPEVVDPRKPVECFGKEASNRAKELLAGQEVSLEADVSQTDKDKYGRLLRYVRTKDGLFFNLEIIKEGYAYEYTYDVPYIYQIEFKAAQKDAEVNKLGLWKPGVCVSN
jgi:micrococcal nuclease